MTFIPNKQYVFIKLPPVTESIKTESGIELAIDTTWDPAKYESVHGEILAIPDGCKHALKAGDQVYFFYLTIPNARECDKDGMYWEEGKERFAVIPFSALFFAIWYLTIEGELDTRPQFEMFNDHILVQPIELDQHVEHIEGYGNITIDDTYKSESGIIIAAAEKDLTDILKTKKYDDQMGVVAHAKSDSGLQAGDQIMFSPDSDVPVEFDLVQTLPLYFRMKVEDVMCKFVDGQPMPINNKVLVYPDPPVKRESSIILLDNGQRKPRSKSGTVKQIGDKVTSVKVGDKIIYGIDGSACDILIDYDKHEIIGDHTILTIIE